MRGKAQTYIVTGAMGCGKTHNRERIAKALCGNEAAYVDDWQPGQPLRQGRVHLTNTPLPCGTTKMSELMGEDVHTLAYSNLLTA